MNLNDILSEFLGGWNRKESRGKHNLVLGEQEDGDLTTHEGGLFFFGEVEKRNLMLATTKNDPSNLFTVILHLAPQLIPRMHLLPRPSGRLLANSVPFSQTPFGCIP